MCCRPAGQNNTLDEDWQGAPVIVGPVRCRQVTARSQHGAGQGSTGDGVPGVLLALQPHQAAVTDGKQGP